MELSKLKHIQRYMTSFAIDFRRFEFQPKINQLSSIFNFLMEMIFETLKTADIDTNPPHSIIEPIFNRNFGNKFHHQNETNQHQPNNINVTQK